MAAFDFGAPAIGRGGLGSQYVPLLRRAEIERMNNGSHLGGLAYALSSGLQGYRRGKDQSQRKEANEALMRGLMGEPALDAPLPEGVSGPVRPALPGSLGGASQELAALDGNPYAGPLATQLMMAQMAKAEEQQALEQRYAREDERYSTQRQDRLAESEADRAFRREMLQAQIAAQRANRQPTAAPSSVREYQYYNSLPPDQQRQYLMMKRANPYLNLGDVFAQPDPTQPGQIMGEIGVGVAPDVTVDKEGGRVITTPGMPGAPRGGIAGTQMTGADRRGARTGAALAPQTGGVGIMELPPSPEQARKQAETDRVRGVQAGVVNETIDLARGLSGDDDWTTGLSGAALSNIPGTDAYTLSNRLDTIRANIGFDKLQAMREASPTGGALGQVSEMENRLLQAVYGSLNQAQTATELRRVLDQVQNTYNEIIHQGIPPQEAQRRLQQLQGGGAPANTGGFSIRRID